MLHPELQAQLTAVDAARNDATRATEAVISAASSRVKVMVIPTNEEIVVAREARRLLERN